MSAANGAAPATTQFFFPDGAFNNLAIFLGVLDTLENVFIGAYLAAARRFAELGQPLLAEIAGQIMGVEAEHRVLGRIIAEEPLPVAACRPSQIGAVLSEASAELAIFLQSSPGNTYQASMPSEAEIDIAVDRFGCAAVAPATPPTFVYLPAVRR